MDQYRLSIGCDSWFPPPAFKVLPPDPFSTRRVQVPYWCLVLVVSALWTSLLFWRWRKRSGEEARLSG
jgi:hypothetical protein